MLASARPIGSDASDAREAYRRTVLGPILTGERVAMVRTAEALHPHVNTVHYRMRRVAHFTGRDLSRLSDRLDLWAALLCR